MRDSLAGLKGREYLRVSAKGDRSIPEQREDNGRQAEREGVTLGAPYQDQGSASRYAQRARDDFDRLVDDLKNDRFNADLLWLWESSRGSRRVGEWVTLIELAEERGVRVFVTTHARAYDPADPRDRRSLLEDAVDSEYESAKTSKRTKRGIEANTAEGRPHGICPFGYAREYEIRRGQLVPVRQYPDPVESPLIVELFTKVRKRVPFAVVERDWAKRGIAGRRGKPMSAETLRHLVTHVCYIGLRATKGTTVKAAWDRLVSDELFYDVQSIIGDPSRIHGNPGTSRYVLTTVIPCAKCSGPITVTYRKQDPKYVCKRGCWSLPKAELDAIFIGDADDPGVILSYLSRDDVYDIFDDDGDGEAAEIRGALAKARADLQETDAAKPESLAEEKRFARRAERLEAEISRLEERLRAFTRPSSLRELFDPSPDIDVYSRWQRHHLMTQRAIAALVLSPTAIGRPRIKPASAVSPSATLFERIEWTHA